MYILEVYFYVHLLIEFLQTIMALLQNASLILGDRLETFTFGQQFINCNRPSATALLERYSSFADFDKGKLVRGSFFSHSKL